MRSLPTLPDPARVDRPVSIRVWYPARQSSVPSDAPGFAEDAPPDPSGGPYPVILSSSKIAYIFAPYLVSHGFAWISVTGLDSYPKMSLEMIDQPLDILFALDQVASGPPDGLEGMLDTDHAGVIGYSFDGYNALAMSGARIDSAYYLGNCPTGDAMAGLSGGRLSAYDCAPALVWDEYVERAGDAIAPGEGGLWRPMSDERIRAAMPMAGEGWWLFGERGLAAVDRPVLMLAADGDALYAENTRIYDHLGTSDKAFISFLGADHMMVLDQRIAERMAHFATAFFGYHLAGREEMAPLFSEAFVAGHDDLAWGTVPPR
jgi:predicted dienelactone hydrolase